MNEWNEELKSFWYCCCSLCKSVEEDVVDSWQFPLLGKDFIDGPALL